MLIDYDAFWTLGSVRIRAAAPDRYAGLRGAAYIAARQLRAPVQRLDLDQAAREAAVASIMRARQRQAPPPSIVRLVPIQPQAMPRADFTELSAQLAALLIIEQAKIK